MSIIKQSIAPSGQPAFTFSGSASHDASQNIQGVLLSHGTHSLKPCRPSPSKSSLAIASGPTIGMKTQRQNGTLGGSVVDGIGNLSQLLVDEGNSHSLDKPITKTLNDDEQSKTVLHDMEFAPFSPTFFSSNFLERKILQQGNCKGQLDHFSFEQTNALAVSVCSAVKLEVEQIDLIARKMQRLTGFRNLRLENIIDPSLIAGFVISYDDDGSHIIDLSVKGQLAALAARVESSDQRHGHNWTTYPHSKS